jgi:hypothetical protein
MPYTIRAITHTYATPFKPQTLYYLWIGQRRLAQGFRTLSDAKRGAKVLAKRWPAPIVIA